MTTSSDAVPSCPDSESNLLAAAAVSQQAAYMLASETDSSCFTGPFRPKLRDMIIEIKSAHSNAGFFELEAQWNKQPDPLLGGLQAIEDLRSCPSPLSGWTWHLEQVLSSNLRRRILKSTESLSANSRNGHTDQELVTESAALASEVGMAAARRDLVTSGSDLSAAIRTQYFASKGTSIDLRMGSRFAGIKPGELFIVLARSWVGKSAWASQAVLNSKANSLVVSLEMPKEQWWRRTLAQAWSVRPTEVARKLAVGDLSQPELQALEAAQSKIFVADRCDGSLPSLLAAVTRCEAIAPVKLLVIDHLSLMRSQGRSDYERASEAVISVKRLARQCNMPVILICQVGRSEGADGSTEVGLASARDSGKIEENADYVLGLWRPAHRKGLEPDRVEELRPQMKGRLVKERDGHGFQWNFRIDPWTILITPEEA